MTEPLEIIAADVGNTSATIVHMRGLEILSQFDVSSHAAADDVAMALNVKLPPGTLALPLVCASVNPRGFEALESAWLQLGGDPAAAAGRDFEAAIRNLAVPPEGAGADRLMNALAARERAGDEAVVVDFGTAITFDIVKDGAYCGGVIAPGIGLAMEALHQKTAMLPLVNPRGKPEVIGRDTASAINAGVYYGYIGLVGNILREVLDTYESRPLVLATGGYGDYLAPEIEGIDEIVPGLTHEGIALAWQAHVTG